MNKEIETQVKQIVNAEEVACKVSQTAKNLYSKELKFSIAQNDFQKPEVFNMVFPRDAINKQKLSFSIGYQKQRKNHTKKIETKTWTGRRIMEEKMEDSNQQELIEEINLLNWQESLFEQTIRELDQQMAETKFILDVKQRNLQFNNLIRKRQSIEVLKQSQEQKAEFKLQINDLNSQTERMNKYKQTECDMKDKKKKADNKTMKDLNTITKMQNLQDVKNKQMEGSKQKGGNDIEKKTEKNKKDKNKQDLNDDPNNCFKSTQPDHKILLKKEKQQEQQQNQQEQLYQQLQTIVKGENLQTILRSSSDLTQEIIMPEMQVQEQKKIYFVKQYETLNGEITDLKKQKMSEEQQIYLENQQYNQYLMEDNKKKEEYIDNVIRQFEVFNDEIKDRNMRDRQEIINLIQQQFEVSNAEIKKLREDNEKYQERISGEIKNLKEGFKKLQQEMNDMDIRLKNVEKTILRSSLIEQFFEIIPNKFNFKEWSKTQVNKFGKKKRSL